MEKRTIRALIVLVAILSDFAVDGVPSVPPPTDPRALLLEESISQAIATGRDEYIIDPGTYVFSNHSLYLSGAENFTIRAENVSFVFFLGYGMQISHSRNVTVQGLTFDSDPPNYAQGKVTNVLSSTEFVATFDDRFILPDVSKPPFDAPGGSAGAKVTIWNATSRLPLGTNFLETSAPIEGLTRTSDFQITLKHPQTSAAVLAGNLVTIFPRRGFTWNCLNCTEVSAEDVTIHAGGNMGFLESGGEGNNHYRRVSIVRKTDGEGLMALNADGFHSDGVGVGPTLEDSVITFTGDDFLNIHNRMQVVCEVLDGNRAITIVDPAGDVALADLRAGDELRFFKLLSGLPRVANPLLASGIVASVRPLTSERDAALVKTCHDVGSVITEPPYNVTLISAILPELTKGSVYLVNFTSSLASIVDAYSLVNFERRSGANFSVRRNIFHDNCGSGGRIIAKAPGGMLDSNIAERFGGVHIYSEQEWLEGALGIRDVQIVNTTIVDARVAKPTQIDVFPGLTNVTCANTTFVIDGDITKRAEGC